MSIGSITTSIQVAAAKKQYHGSDSTAYSGSTKIVTEDMLSMVVDDPTVTIPAEYYRNHTGTQLLRVAYKPFPDKCLFLQVMNNPLDWGGGPPDNFHNVHGVIRDIDYNRRASNEPMPNFGAPTEGIDGFCWITPGAPITKNLQAGVGSNMGGITQSASSVDPGLGTSIIDAKSGANMTISENGISFTGAGTGGGDALLTIGTPSGGNAGDFEIGNSLNSTKPDKKGFIIQNIIRKMIGVDQNVIILPFWEDLPDINKILTWANLGVFVFQVINKIERLDRAVKSGN